MFSVHFYLKKFLNDFFYEHTTGKRTVGNTIKLKKTLFANKNVHFVFDENPVNI